jgi:hypothetical protein
MKRYLFAALMPIIFLTSSCKKNSEKTANIDPCNQITEMVQFYPYGNPQYQSEAVFTYNENGRLSTVKGQGQYTVEYVYHSDRIEMKAKAISGDNITNTYYLDKNQRVTRTAGDNYDYKYDANGYLISYQQPYGSTGISGYTQYFLKYENDNLIELYTNDPNVSKKKVTFTYYSEPNQDLMGFNSPFFQSSVIYERETFFLIRGGFFGKQSKNLLKGVDPHDGYGERIVKYTKDSKGRIINQNEAYTYRYQCP